MADLKTKPTKVSVESYLATIEDAAQRADSKTILALMKEITGQAPRMWGPSMIGFGAYHYKYDSGHEGDCFQIGFAPRKGQLSLYFMPGVFCFADQLARLGKHKTGKACLYIKKLADVDENVLREMIEIAYADMQNPKQMMERAKAMAGTPARSTAPKRTGKKMKGKKMKD